MPPDPAAGRVPAAPFRVLLVCTANLCRSPMAEALLRAAVADAGLDWEVESAGVHPVDGLAVPEPVAVALGELGLAVPPDTGAPLTPAEIEAADLILTAESAHRARVAELHPASMRKSFMLRQFARYAGGVTLLGDQPARIGAELLTAVNTARTGHQPSAPGADDIADPIGGEPAEYAACRDLIRDAVGELLAPVLGSPAGRAAAQRREASS